MNVYGILCCLSLIVTVQCANNTDIEALSEIVLRFTAKLALRLLYPSRGSNDSFVFSGLRIVSTLIELHHLGSEKVKEDIKRMLDLTESLEKCGCNITNMLTSYDVINPTESGMLYSSTLFYRQDMKLLDGVLKNPCVSGNFQSLDFTDKYNALDTINEFYNVWNETFFNRYLLKALPANTNEFIMDRLRMKIVMETPFTHGETIVLTNIKGKNNSLSSMQKVGNFSYKFSGQYNAYLIREDFVGGRFSYVVMLPNYRTENFREELKPYFEMGQFSGILLEAMSLSDKTRMGLRMPELDLIFRVDLRRTLEDMGLPRSLGDIRALTNMTNNSSNMTQFLHSEFIKISTDKNNSKETDQVEYVEVSRPFMFFIMDNKFNIPIKTVIYTGISKSSEIN